MPFKIVYNEVDCTKTVEDVFLFKDAFLIEKSLAMYTIY